MMRFILPVIIAAIGLGAGIGAGIALRPAPKVDNSSTGAEKADGGHENSAHAKKAEPATDDDKNAEEKPEYVKLNNQFIVPIVKEGKVTSMVIMSISLEAPHGASEEVYAVEPKLRDGMLSVLFDHANSGGFSGSFTDASNLVALRRALSEVAQGVLGPKVTDVLITDIMRQDS